jgi:iron complex outermembrane receptor protein
VQSANSVKYFTYYPAVTFNLFTEYRPIKALAIIPRIELTGARYADTEGGTKLNPYVLAHLKLTYDLNQVISISISGENIFDTLYEIQQYTPLAGRSLTIGMNVTY